MKINYLILGLFATMMCGCSSSSDEPQQPLPDDPATMQSVFQPSPKPSWSVDWVWDLPQPDWFEADAHNYSCSMQILIHLYDDLLPYVSEDDQMAVFMNGTCRAISKPNIIDDGESIIYLLNIQGEDEETRGSMQLHFYSTKLKHLFIIDDLPPFKPNNLWEDDSSITIWLGQGSTKYPFTTGMTVLLPDNPEYEKLERDTVYVFVGNECRGVLATNPDYPGFKGTVWSRQPNETAEIRYYSDSKQGYYTLKQQVVLNNYIQVVNFQY